MFRHILPAVGCVILTTSLATASTYSGPSYVEPGDAGSTRDDAADVKNPNGTGPINHISGSLSGTGGFLRSTDGDYQDVFRIYIKDPGDFKIDLEAIAGNVPDSMMFLFDEEGLPIMASNHTNPDNFNPILDNVNNPFAIEEGVFYLAITSAPSEALVQVGGQFISLFNLLEHPFGTVGPVTDAADLSWTSAWSAPDGVNVGEYVMNVKGVESLPIPGPAGIALLALAGAMGKRRRRR